MGWTAYYQILRDRPLDEAEVITLYDFVRRTSRTPWEGEDFHLKVTREPRPDHVLAYGAQKFPLSDESDDQERLCEVLTALSKLIDGVEVRLADDFETMGWDEDAGEAAMNGSTTELVSIRDYEGFVDPATLVGSRPEPLSEEVDGLLGGGKAKRKNVDWQHDVEQEEQQVLATLRSELGLVEAPTTPSSRPPPPDVGALLDSAPVVPMPFPADPPPKQADVLDELLAVLGKEAVPSADLLARAALPPRIAQMSSWDAGRALAGHLIEQPPAQLLERLVAMLPEIHRAGAVGDICAYVFPRMIDQPGTAERLLDLWEQAIATPWDSSSRATTCLMSVASHPTIFQRMLDEVAAPDDGPLRNRTSGAFELLSAAVQHKAQAVRALVARIRRDRGRPRDLVAWRRDAMRALRKLGAEDAVPTAILELAELTSVQTANELFELLARYSSGIGALQQAVDMRDCARDAVSELCRASEELRQKYSKHPFWKIRLVAADRHPGYDQGRREVAAVWADIDHANLPMSADDDRYLRPNDVKKARPDPTAPTTLPHPRDGMAASCFDYRAWSLWAVDQLTDPADAAARIFADELDIAMVDRGHTRIAPRWTTWRATLPDLPRDRRDRLAWARAQTNASLPPALARVRDDGAHAVAATLPAPHLVLPPEIRHELEERERIVAEAGEALFVP